MARRVAILIALGVLGLLCQGSPQEAGFPPLPGPALDAEAVAVSPEIATSERPVFYVGDPSNDKRLLAYDWSGTLRGVLVVSALEPFGVEPSADGTMLLLTHAHIVSGGHVLGRVAPGTWAGDDAHLCTFLNELGGPGRTRERWLSPNVMEGLSTPGALFYESVTGTSHKLLDYGAFGPHGGPAVLACSAPADRAVIGGSFVATLSGLTMVRLSDGHVISQSLGGSHLGPDGTLVSKDGTLLALGSTGGITQPGLDGFTVFRIPGNQVVAEINGLRIEAFSADGAQVLTVEDVGWTNEHRRYQVIDLTTLRTLWTSPVLSPGDVRSRPGTGDFLIGSWTYEASTDPNGAAHPFEDLWLVPAEGPARLLLRHVAPL
jgi:hypothetical protein